MDFVCLGFIDIFSESKEGLDVHSSMILRFLHRNRLSSPVIPYPVLDHCNNMSTMRSSVLKEALDQLVQKEKDIDKMTNGETSSYWQSDGSARSHWIRLKMKPDVVLRHLSIAVAATDQSYMPQQVTVAVGRSASDLQEVRDVHIPSNVTGYVTLLENANISQLCKPLQLTLQACDVKGKEEKSGPENLLVEPWTRDECPENPNVGTPRADLLIGCPSDNLGEDDPIGWFELEEEWDEADVKLQQCRVAKYLMVKFLCTRQESAERLGVQGLSVSGYLRPARAEAEQSIVRAHCRKGVEESVCGATLLLRTLQFIQQLAHDLVQQKESGLKYRSFLDFAGLDLQIFWDFYSKLKQNPREECICAQTLLLQLLQSCFSVLQGDAPATSEDAKAPSMSCRRVEAAKELYTHLCDVVDRVDGDSAPMEILKQEVRNTLLNGAAVFFPDRQTRRDHLFTMMKNVTEQEHKQSLQLTFRSLCTYFSDKDPGGLLLLPEKGDLADVDIGEVLAAMNTLLSVAARECELLMVDGAQGEVGSVLFSLFWSVQGSLLSWCYLQLKSTDSGAKDLAADLIEKSRQLVIFLLDFCTLDISHCTLLREFSALTELLKELCSDPDGGLNKKVTFKAGPRLQFLFHSDSSNNEWGYKFTVTAYGLPDVAVSWGLDLQLLVSRLMGRLASQCMALKSLHLNSGGKTALSEEIAQVYSLADGIRIWMLEMKQKSLMSLGNEAEEQRGSEAAEVNPESLAAPPAVEDRSPGLDVQPTLPPSSGAPAAEVSSATAEEPSSPSTPTRRPPFTRGRLRLLSFRSVEEARPLPTVKEKYPVLKDAMDFIKDQSLSHESQWSEEDELADAKQNSEWMDECQDGMFEAWYEKIAQEDPEKQRKMHMFIARYCDLLNVDISCDGCDEIAPWHRYRCLQCSDMDLCKTCFLGGVKPEGHGDDHEMVNMEFTCDHCQGLIIGRRMNCNVCDDFDLCYGCYAAKKYSYGITAHPMVTIRISDRQRLIQPYIHNYSWLLFAALALYSTHLASAEDMDGEKLDPQARNSAATLRSQCMQLVGDCLMKAHQGKGLKALALLGILPDGDSTSEKQAPPVTVPTQTSEEQPEKKAIQAAVEPADAGPFVHRSGKRDVPKEVTPLDCKQRSKAGEGASLLKGPSCQTQISDSPADAHAPIELPDAENSEASCQKPIEEKAVTPSPEQVFAECSQKRILGLLAAMLPPLNSDPTVPLIDLEHVLPLMFQVVISNAGHLNETYHLTLGLLGQLIIRLSPVEVDAAVTKVLSAKHNLFAAGDSSIVPDGWKTTHLLFSLGAVCLDSRVGLDWACSMAEILRSLNSAPLWRDVIATFTDHCIKQLPFQLKHTNIFTLLVLVGFPQVLCAGTRCVYMDNANEPHNVIILKHFTEKNRAVIVNVKTRKRKTVKDYQLVQKGGGPECSNSQAQLSQYSQHFAFIASHLLQTSMDSHCPEAVEATWVLSLALKGLYKTLKTDLLKLLVKKCSKGTGFSKTWLLRDLEILSIMLYSSKKEISTLAEHGELELDERGDQEEEVERSVNSPGEPEQKKLDPLESLDEPTRICFLMAHDALNAPLHILRAIYELQMKRTDSFFLEVQKRFDGDELTTDERIRTLAQRWQPSRSLRLDEQSAKAVDTDMIILPCLSRPARCDQATTESNPVTQKLISSTESELQQSYAKQRRSKSAALLHKELNCKSKRAVRDYLFRVNEATAVLYARHVLASLLAEWPGHVPVSEDILELSGPAHMTYILDMFMQLEEKHQWEKILQKVLQGCRENMLGTMALAACQFMEEPGMEVQVRESKHPYNNNTNFEDKVHIPGAIYLSIKFDPQCNTEEGCDELAMSSSGDFQQDRHNFSGSQQKWKDFELPGDTLYYRFTSDMSNTEWGYKFTVTAGHLGRFQTGFEILRQMLSEERVVPHLPDLCDLMLLKPLWQLFTQMEYSLFEDVTQPGILLPLHRALTELFFVTENRAQELGLLQDYLLALTTDDHLLRCAAQALQNIAAISLAINYPNKATRLWNVEC
ncbi:hypothetical protein J1605_008856 [Eschrichtius robustus]|uniref:Zinc finger ZZ-type and EF-hand domain-containing protein 1 n=1 Tax=Eschrichtius robustus TaxID=9764 RepID=A0AB34GUN1_ESCRO|nr:hypothetical protein J1605_008856 [Eschrichtius robustus]